MKEDGWFDEAHPSEDNAAVLRRKSDIRADDSKVDVGLCARLAGSTKLTIRF